MKFLIRFLGFLGAGCLAAANPLITTPASCSITGWPPIPSDSSCMAGSLSTGVYAEASSSASLTLNPFTWSSAQIDESVLALTAWNPNGPSPLVIASAEATIHADLTTSGPVRPGFVELWLTSSGGGSPDDFYSTISYSVGSYSYQCNGAGHFDSCPGTYTSPFVPRPVTLGTTFSLDLTSSLFAYPIAAFNSLSRGDFTLKVAFRVFDQNGFVPVAYAAAVPETSTLGMTICSLAFVFFLAKWRVAHKRHP